MSMDREFRLGNRELEILSVVWELGDATVHDVCERLKRPGAYTTILTMMRTLESKGYLTHHSFGRTFVYRTVVSLEEVQTARLLEVRKRLFGGSSLSLVSSMVNNSPMSETELSELRSLLEQACEARNRLADQAPVDNPPRPTAGVGIRMA